jgi:hypothetical protein
VALPLYFPMPSVSPVIAVFASCLPGHLLGPTSCQIRRRRRLLGATLRAIAYSCKSRRFLLASVFSWFFFGFSTHIAGTALRGAGDVAYNQMRLAGECIVLYIIQYQYTIINILASPIGGSLTVQHSYCPAFSTLLYAILFSI